MRAVNIRRQFAAEFGSNFKRPLRLDKFAGKFFSNLFVVLRMMTVSLPEYRIRECQRTRKICQRLKKLTLCENF